MMKKSFIINNIGIDTEIYTINEYIQLRQDENDLKRTWVYIRDNQQEWYGSQILFFYALVIAIPKVHISIDSRKQEHGETEFSYYLYKDSIRYLNSYMFNYYFDVEGDFDISQVIINKKDVEKIKNSFDIVVGHNKERKEKLDEKIKDISRWLIAYNHYLAAYRSISVDLSIQNMITVLEALLVKGSGELNYKVALFTSLIVETDMEKRKEASKLVKYMYDIRSKSVHGEIMSAQSKLKNLDYSKYYRFKELVSEVLIKTYGKNEDEIFNALENMIYSSNKFEDYISQ